MITNAVAVLYDANINDDEIFALKYVLGINRAEAENCLGYENDKLQAKN